jgi:hypothetical protein
MPKNPQGAMMLYSLLKNNKSLKTLEINNLFFDGGNSLINLKDHGCAWIEELNTL